MTYPTQEMQPLLEEIGALLNETGQTLAIAESTTGGLLSAALLSVNGAAGWYKGGAVLYTLDARSQYAGWTEEDVANYRGPTEDVASTLAQGVKHRLNATICIGEAGIAGPMSPSRRLPPGLTCLAVVHDEGPAITKTIMTGVRERVVNMHAFTDEALKLLREVLLQKQRQQKSKL